MTAAVRARGNAAQSGVGRVAVGIDPSRAALQIALLSPHGDERRERRVPLGPAAVNVLAEVLAGEPAVIAIEGSHSTGQLFVLELLARQYDVREIQPFVSKRFRQALSDDHTDQKDARGLAQLARWKPDLPRVRFSEEQATCKRLARLREQLVGDRTRYANRLHACLSETYGAVYKPLFSDLLANKALAFFSQYPTLNDALEAADQVVVVLGEQAWSALEHAGRWQEGPYLECLRAEARALVAHLQALKDRVAELDRAIAQLAEQPAVALLLSMPGVGLRTALAVVGDTGQPTPFPRHPSLRGVLWLGSGYPPEWWRRPIAQAPPALQPPSQTCLPAVGFQPNPLERTGAYLLRPQTSIRQEPLGGTALPQSTAVPHRLPHAHHQLPVSTSKLSPEHTLT
jgi:transposase